MFCLCFCTSKTKTDYYIFVPGVIPSRYILAVLGSIGMAIVYGLKVNLSVAMVGMLNHTAIKMHVVHSSHDDVDHGEPVEECVATSGSGNATVSFHGNNIIYRVNFN